MINATLGYVTGRAVESSMSLKEIHSSYKVHLLYVMQINVNQADTDTFVQIFPQKNRYIAFKTRRVVSLQKSRTERIFKGHLFKLPFY